METGSVYRYKSGEEGIKQMMVQFWEKVLPQYISHSVVSLLASPLTTGASKHLTVAMKG